MQQKGIEAYIKYNTFDKEQKEGIKAFSNDSLYYNEAENCLTCRWDSEWHILVTGKE
ncbi:hypothetical protein [Mucilaginibacter sp.]|uniref:hypothetical protein n=1 Tax=Mucilaginibacter sp. TaxID=1882438 RepID=UPI00260D606E|nr:hypothetical protein [Mucilaginibacter sp.]